MAFDYANPKGQGNRIGLIGVVQDQVEGNDGGTPVMVPGVIGHLPSSDYGGISAMPNLNFLISGDGGNSALALDFHWRHLAGTHLTFDFGEPVSFEKVRLTGVPYAAYSSAQWQGSNDGVTWHDVGNPFDIRFDDPSGGGMVKFYYMAEFPGPADEANGGDPYDGCRYWRIAKAAGFQEGSGVARILHFDFKIDTVAVRGIAGEEPTGVLGSPASYYTIFGSGVRHVGPDKLITLSKAGFDWSGVADELHNNITGSAGPWPGTLITTPYTIRAEFAKAITMRSWQSMWDRSANNGTWEIYGSNDGTSFDLLKSFTWDQQYTMVADICPVGTTYKFYEWRSAGSHTFSNNPYYSEWLYGVLQFPIERGDRSSRITVTTDLTVASGDVQNIVNGTEGFNGATAQYVEFGTESVAGKYIEFEFDDEYAVCGMQFIGINGGHFDTVTGKVQLHDGDSWVDLTSDFSFAMLTVSGFAKMWDNDGDVAGSRLRFLFSGGTMPTSSRLNEVNFLVFGAPLPPPPAIGPWPYVKGDDLIAGQTLALNGRLGGSGNRWNPPLGGTDSSWQIVEPSHDANPGWEGSDSFDWFHRGHVLNNDFSSEWLMTGAADAEDSWLQFKFLLRPTIVKGFQTFFGSTPSMGNWTVEATNDPSGTWTEVVASFAWNAQNLIVNFQANETAYTYYRLRGLAGSSIQNGRFNEIEFDVVGYEFERGNRSAIIDVTTDLTLSSGGDAQKLVNGNLAAAAFALPSQTITGKHLTFDFKGRNTAIAGIGTRGTYMGGVWDVQVFHGGNWYDVGIRLALPQGVFSNSAFYPFPNIISGTKFRLLGVNLGRPIDTFNDFRDTHLLGVEPSPGKFNFDGIGGRGPRPYVTVTTDLTHTGTLAELVDGDVSSANGVEIDAQDIDGKHITFDFMAPVNLHDLRMFFDTEGDFGVWTFQSSDDGVTFTDTGAVPFALTSDANMKAFAAEAGQPFASYINRRYWRMLGVEGVIDAARWNEIEFGTRYKWFEGGPRFTWVDKDDLSDNYGGLVLNNVWPVVESGHGVGMALRTPAESIDGLGFKWPDGTDETHSARGLSLRSYAALDTPDPLKLNGVLIWADTDNPGVLWQLSRGIGDPSNTQVDIGSPFNPWTTGGVYVPFDLADCHTLQMRSISGPTIQDGQIMQILLHGVQTPPIFGDPGVVEFEDDGKLTANPTVGGAPSAGINFVDDTDLEATPTVVAPPITLVVEFVDDAELSVREHNERAPPIQIFINLSGH